jgi:hypothetical protein
MPQSIELDCAPFTPRPDEYIEAVLAGTGFKVKDFDTGAPIFGCQTWTLRDESREKEFIDKKPVFQRRITDLYHTGAIRYGSW